MRTSTRDKPKETRHHVDTFEAEPCTTDLYVLGECCRWDEVRGELYWVDVYAGHFFRAFADHTALEVVRRYELGGNLSALAPLVERSDGWIAAVDRSLWRLDESGQKRETVQLEDDATLLLNDGAADPWGSFWVGSMNAKEDAGRGSVFRYRSQGRPEKMFSDTSISNGIGWSPDRTTMYFADSGPGTITAYDVDGDGDISHPRLFAQLDTASEGTPDGLCVDADGCLWVAVWGGYEVRRYAPTGEVVARVGVATAQPTCCALGGANGTTLYITTASVGLSPSTLDAEPDAGRLFAVNVGVTGQPLDPFRPLPRD